MAALDETTIRALMDKQDNIRNISIIAHVDHGKTTLTDSLVQLAGIISEHKAGTQRFTDTRADEQERCITIKSTAISMYYRVEDLELKRMGLTTDGNEFLINLIDSPGHVDFSSEVSAALRVTDGALVVVSIVANVSIQTKTVLVQALAELSKPILFMNKMDSAFNQGASSEEVYQTMNKDIETINVIIATNVEEDSPLGSYRVDPLEDSVVFGSGLNCWAFRICDVSDMMTARKMAEKGEVIDKASDKFTQASKAFSKYLWGEYYFDHSTKKVVTKPGENRDRMFCYFILDIIREVSRMELDVESMETVIRRLRHDFVAPAEAANKSKNEIFRLVMKSFLPAGTSLLSSIVRHLPSPKVAQAYREKLLYTGEHDDASAMAIKNCDPKGPLMVYVSKMVPSAENNRFFAMCRVFSGTIDTNTKFTIIPADSDLKNSKSFENKNAKRVCICLASRTMATSSVPAGNVCALMGIDEWLVRSGTICSEPGAKPIRTMKFSVSPIMQKVIWPKNSADLTKLVNGLNSMVKADPIISYKSIEDGKYVISGTGEMHLDINLKDLQDMYAKGVEISIGEPIVEYRETIDTKDTPDDYLAVVTKSSNGHNRLRMRACFMAESCIKKIEEGEINTQMTAKERAKAIVLAGVPDQLTSDVWRFAPEQPNLTRYGSNFINNATSGVDYLKDCKDGIVKGFTEVASQGPLTGSELRGVIFSLEDASFHSDVVHRNSGMISMTSKRACIASLLINGARLVEPYFQVEVEHPRTQQSSVNDVIGKRSGLLIDAYDRTNSAMVTVAHIPVRRSFDLLPQMRKETSGTAFPNCSFSHWAMIDEDPYETPIETEYMTNTAAIVRSIRKRRKLNEKLPVAADFYDPILTKQW